MTLTFFFYNMGTFFSSSGTLEQAQDNSEHLLECGFTTTGMLRGVGISQTRPYFFLPLNRRTFLFFRSSRTIWIVPKTIYVKIFLKLCLSGSCHPWVIISYFFLFQIEKLFLSFNLRTSSSGTLELSKHYPEHLWRFFYNLYTAWSWYTSNTTNPFPLPLNMITFFFLYRTSRTIWTAPRTVFVWLFLILCTTSQTRYYFTTHFLSNNFDRFICKVLMRAVFCRNCF